MQELRAASCKVSARGLAHRIAQVALTLIGAIEMSGCASIPRGRAAVDTVDVEGTSELDAGDVENKLATTASPRFLGLFQGVVYDYEIFNRAVLQRDLQRVERYYRARGYYRARVRAGRVFYEDNKHVRVEIVVEEGPPVIVRRIDVRGLQGLPSTVITAAKQARTAHLKLGEPFDEDDFQKTESAIRRALTDNGYAYAKVTRIADVDIPQNRASVAFDVKANQPAKYGEVTIHGLGKIPEAPVRRALDITPGDPYSTAELESAQQALLELGVFTSVVIEPVLDEPPPASRIVPLRVRVEPSRLRSVQLGGGIQLDSLRTDVHLLAGWEHRNFFGGLRHFSVQFRPGVVLYPTRLPTLQPPTHFLPEEKLRAELRQPGFIEARTNGFVRSEYNIYPLILSAKVDDKDPVIGYRELRAAVGVDRTFGKFFASPMHNIQSNTPFAYVGAKDKGLGPVLVSYPELFTTLDFRDDRVQPHKGAYFSNDLQVAGVGGAARDIKVQPEARAFIPLTRRTTLALRATTGLLFPQNYGSFVEPNQAGTLLGSTPSLSEEQRRAWIKDIQIMFFRGFFSGGPSSNRGYPLRGIGPHGIVPFYNPNVPASSLSDLCNPANVEDYSPSRCVLPLGGFTLWEASLEVRFPLLGPLTGVTFCDTSDVSPRQVNYRFDRPHLSCGIGPRYETPVGPIRVDIGYRIPGFQKPADATGEPDPEPLFWDLPIAIAFGIGEAF